MNHQNVKVIAECKKMRRNRTCGRECSFWHTHSRDKLPAFCKSAERRSA